KTYRGFNIVPASFPGSSGISWEFTAQMVEAMRYVDQLYSDGSFEPVADMYLSEIAQAQASAPFGDGQGLVAGPAPAGDLLLPSQQCVLTPFKCFPERVGLAATTWAILAEQQLNLFVPFAPPRLTPTPAINTLGGIETVTFTGSSSSSDWIGLFRTSDGTRMDMRFISACT